MRKTAHAIRFPSDKDKSLGRPEAKSSKLYNKYKDATTTTEFFARGGDTQTLKWDMERGICVFVDPNMDRLRIEWAAEQAATKGAHQNRQLRGGVRADTAFVSDVHADMPELADASDSESESDDEDEHDCARVRRQARKQSRFDPALIEQAIMCMNEDELDLFERFMNDRPDVQRVVQQALVTAHARTLGVTEREYEDIQRGVQVPDISSNDYSLYDRVHDATHDMFMCSHGGHFCLDPNCDHTACIPQEIVLRLVAADDIEVVSEEIVDLGNYTQDQRDAFIKEFSKEIRGLADIGTFQEVNYVPRGKKVIPSKNVYKIKLKADGSFDRFKTRTTIKGFHQRQGQEYFSTFSPTGSLTVFRALLAIAVRQNLPVWQSDLPMAFVQSDIDAEVIMELPPGSYYRTADGRRSKLVQLARALYGTKQAPQLFNHELNHWLTTVANFTRCDAEPCLYWYLDDKGFVLLFDLVDDLLITGPNDVKIEAMRVGLKKRFARDPRFGEVKWDLIDSYYGVNVKHNRESGELSMDLSGKINKLFSDHPLLAKLNGNRMTPVSTPLPVTHGNGKHVGSNVDGDRPDNELLAYLRNNYRHFTGCLIFMAMSCRVDLAQAVATLSQHMQDPTTDDTKLMRHTLRYLDQNRGVPLIYKREGNAIEELITEISEQDPNVFVTSSAEDIDVYGMHDANFAPDRRTDRKSTSGYCFWLLSCLISWKSKLQPVVAPSTHAAELIAADFAADEALWLRRIMLEIGFVFMLPTNDLVCNIHVFGVPKFRPIEEQALNNEHYHQPEALREFACLHLLEDSPAEQKLMMLVTPLPAERFAQLDEDTKIKLSVDRVKAYIADARTTSSVKHHSPSPAPSQPPDWSPPSTPRPKRPTTPDGDPPNPTSPPSTPRPAQNDKGKIRIVAAGFPEKLLSSASDSAVADGMARARCRADKYAQLHTKDGTLRRFTEDMEPVSNEPYKLDPIQLLGDNKSVTFTANNPLTSSKSRWLDVRWFRLREFVKAGFVKISHIFTQQNVADFFTKPLQKDSFLRLRRFLMNS